MRSLPRMLSLPLKWEAARVMVEEAIRDVALVMTQQRESRYREITYRGGEVVALGLRGLTRPPYAIEVVHVATKAAEGTAVAGVDPFPAWTWSPVDGVGNARITGIGGLSAGTDYLVRLRITEGR